MPQMSSLIKAAALAACLGNPSYAAAEFSAYGHAALRLSHTDGEESWTRGGFGRFDAADADIALDGQLALDFRPADSLQFYLHTTARAEDTANATRPVGVIEGFVDYRPLDTDSQTLVIRAGQQFLPSSMENVDDLWQSPYTLTFSAWNSWIGHEVRPIGLRLNYDYRFTNGNRLRLLGMAFRGNDTSGTSLAWGGWRFSQRLSVYGETLPLPALPTLQTGGAFQVQNDEGTIPFAGDLDDETGHAAMIDFASSRVRLKATWFDNRGDGRRFNDEWAWATDYVNLGFEWTPSNTVTIAGEWADGATEFGPPQGGVKTTFDTAYLLASWTRGNHRLSARAETFGVDDVDGRPVDNSDDGSAFTVSHFYSAGQFRFGTELMWVSGDRPALPESGLPPEDDTLQLRFEVRYTF